MSLLYMKNMYKTLRKRKESSIKEQKTLTDTFTKRICEGPITRLKDAQYHWYRGHRLTPGGDFSTHL